MKGQLGRSKRYRDLRLVMAYLVVAFIAVGLFEAQFEYDPDAEAQQDIEEVSEPVYVTRDVHSMSGHTDEGSTSQESFTIEHPYVRWVQVELYWSDDYGDNDELSLRLLYAGEEVGSVSGTSGPLAVEVEDENGTLTGEFTVEVTAIDCPGVIPSSPVDRDTGNNWNFVVQAEVSEGVDA
jgi:hypothetical protein